MDDQGITTSPARQRRVRRVPRNDSPSHQESSGGARWSRKVCRTWIWEFFNSTRAADQIACCQLLLVYPRKKQGVVVDDRIGDQPGAFVPDLLLRFGLHAEFTGVDIGDRNSNGDRFRNTSMADFTFAGVGQL